MIAGAAEDASAPFPLLTQARLAARHRMPHELVLHRYMAAKLILHHFVLDEVSSIPDLEPTTLGKALAAQELAFERLVVAASGEYERETTSSCLSPEARVAERVRRLLDGEPVDPSPLEYDLSVHHLGLVAPSTAVRPLLRELSAESDARLLAVTPHEDETWAWIGARRRLDVERVIKWAVRAWPASTPLGIGEPAEGLSGWRHSHAQARAAAGIARPGASPAVRYRDVGLIVAVARDPLLVASLQETYLKPLNEAGKRGDLIRETLRAYFAADRNARATSAALGVSRQTVSNRVKEVERLFGQPLTRCADDLSAALRLEELGGFSQSPDFRS